MKTWLLSVNSFSGSLRNMHIQLIVSMCFCLCPFRKHCSIEDMSIVHPIFKAADHTHVRYTRRQVVYCTVSANFWEVGRMCEAIVVASASTALSFYPPKPLLVFTFLNWCVYSVFPPTVLAFFFLSYVIPVWCVVELSESHGCTERTQCRTSALDTLLWDYL